MEKDAYRYAVARSLLLQLEHGGGRGLYRNDAHGKNFIVQAAVPRAGKAGPQATKQLLSRAAAAGLRASSSDKSPRRLGTGLGKVN